MLIPHSIARMIERNASYSLHIRLRIVRTQFDTDPPVVPVTPDRRSHMQSVAGTDCRYRLKTVHARRNGGHCRHENILGMQVPGFRLR